VHCHTSASSARDVDSIDPESRRFTYNQQPLIVCVVRRSFNSTRTYHISCVRGRRGSSIGRQSPSSHTQPNSDRTRAHGRRWSSSYVAAAGTVKLRWVHYTCAHHPSIMHVGMSQLRTGWDSLRPFPYWICIYPNPIEETKRCGWVHSQVSIALYYVQYYQFTFFFRKKLKGDSWFYPYVEYICVV
jgi:hypothetical protein